MKNSFLWMILGVISIIGGVIALANPLAATFAAVKIAGWLFLFVGIAQIFAAFREETLKSKIWPLILAAVGILIGIELLADPLRGVVTLTIAVAILFLVTGIGKLFMAFEFRGQNGFWMFLISGALSVLLAIMVFNNFNEAAGRLLGLILAIELISNGVTMIAISMAVKRMGGATA